MRSFNLGKFLSSIAMLGIVSTSLLSNSIAYASGVPTPPQSTAGNSTSHNQNRWSLAKRLASTGVKILRGRGPIETTTTYQHAMTLTVGSATRLRATGFLFQMFSDSLKAGTTWSEAKVDDSKVLEVRTGPYSSRTVSVKPDGSAHLGQTGAKDF